MVVKKTRKFLGTAERFVEDVILIVLSLFVIFLSISALGVLSAAEGLGRTDVCELAGSGIVGKAEFFAQLVGPWVAMIVGLLIVRELWLIRRTLGGKR